MQTPDEAAAGGARGSVAGAGRSLVRFGAGVAIVVASAALFALVTRHTHPHDIDSGPYLSMARHWLADGRPLSSFNFLGNVERLPGVPNFIPPGLPLAIAPALAVTGDALVAGRVVMFLSLLLSLWFAWRLLVWGTGDAWYAALGAAAALCGARVAGLSASVLSDLPFIACTLGALLAAARVLDGTASPALRWLGLPAALALVPLMRFLGVFLPPLVVVLVVVREARRSPAAALAYGAFLGAASVVPLGLFLLLARRDSPAFTALRPASHFGWLEAVSGAAGYLGGWLLPWLALGAVLTASLWLGSPRPPAAARSAPRPSRSWLPLLAAACYLLVLLVVRTDRALYPLLEIGQRYMMPVWPLAFLALAIAFHERVFVRFDRRRRLALALGALALVAWDVRALAALRSGPPFPTQTATFQSATRRIKPHAVVLANHGQPLAQALPEAEVLGIPSRHDFLYTSSLPEVIEAFDVEWIVLFPHRGYQQTYPGWYDRLVRGDTRGLRVRGQWRLRDGVIYRLQRPPEQ